MSDIGKPDQIDIVVTWVDGNDPDWRKEKGYWYKKLHADRLNSWLTQEERYRDWNLLRYWFRCIEKNAPWVRKIHFVTWGHVPDWLDIDNPKLNVVRHQDFIPERFLPTFNSHTIELNIHRIVDLSEQFIYFNDDMYLLGAKKPTDFFENGLPRDFAGLELGYLNDVVTDYRPYNAEVINHFFSKNEVIRKNPFLWFNPIYGPRCLMKTALLMPFEKFSAIQQDHLPICFLKSTFMEVWDKAPKQLEQSCVDKFRGERAVSPWLMRDWQRVQGKFVPMKPCLHNSFACGNGGGRKSQECICSRIRNDEEMICLNDYCKNDLEFQEWGQVLRVAFDARFPMQSSFEKKRG